MTYEVVQHVSYNLYIQFKRQPPLPITFNYKYKIIKTLGVISKPGRDRCYYVKLLMVHTTGVLCALLPLQATLVGQHEKQNTYS